MSRTNKLPYGTKFYLVDEYKTLYIDGRRFMIRHVIKNKQSCYFVEELGDYGNTCRVWGGFNNPREALHRIKGLINVGIKPYGVIPGHASTGMINSFGEIILDPEEV